MTADRQIRALRGKRREATLRVLGELRRQGCEAGGYRLAGEMLNRLCCRHLYAADRMLIAWPNTDLALVIAVGRHDDSAGDIYRLLLEAFDLTVSPDERGKPSCCDDDGLPPIDPDAASDMANAMKRLASRARRSGP